ncbi:MAG: crosslink repair DNA glycosylase YcaQ family protein [Deltaproteobacteria bacterium]|nr:crosslink repair DNA glycosylase YcaQ family protein [Deltaproteobacteria bacterium]
MSQARALAIRATGLGGDRSEVPTSTQREHVIERLGLLQIDSVNVLVRAHFMPLFSRLGGYAREGLEGAAYAPTGRTLFEYWAHEASMVPVARHKDLRWRMSDAREGRGIYAHIAKFGRENTRAVDEVLRELRERGPLRAADLKGPPKSSAGWWEWSHAKLALEWLFWTGQVSTSRRENAGFARVYDLSERVIPAAHFEAKTPTREGAHRALIEHAARALGVATGDDLQDYFRLPKTECVPRIRELVEQKRLREVRVEGWKKPAYVHTETVLAEGERVSEDAVLLSPFDPLVWRRERTERLFGFRYRIEIYTPEAKREFGYYCLPVLHKNALVGRLDLKADRAAKTLCVEAAHTEPGVALGETAGAMARELRRMADWLGLAEITVARKGNAAVSLARACKAKGGA